MGGRILIGAPGSGSGKTLLVCGLLTALKKRGLSCRSYKCGPDYIDPMFHRSVLGIESGNLDSYFSTPEEIRKRVGKETADCGMTVIEGVMGYYDGLGGNSVRASSYDIASITGTPAVLVINGRGAGLSLAALVKGFREFQKDSRIEAVIVNRTSPMMAERLRGPIEETGAAFLGCLPELKDLHLESRHLGLVMPGEVKRLEESLERLAEEMERRLDLDRLLLLAEKCEELSAYDVHMPGGQKTPGPKAAAGGERIPVGVARDEAFCFYYGENLRMLEKMGAELVEFSPLRDEKLPEGICGLILGGGYPELHAGELEKNASMRESVRRAAGRGLPVMAECGGFLYLKEQLEGADGKMYAMVGHLKGVSKNAGRLTRFGYLELQGLPEGPVKGHEFHYWDCTENGNFCRAVKPGNGRSWDCMERSGAVTAGFPHLYYPSNPAVPEEFMRKCRTFRKENLTERNI